MPIDLHTHSSRSDGTATPTELVAEAAAHGLDVVALTDHDTVDGWQEAATAAVANGITLVRGIELSTRYDGRSVHLLAYLPDPSYQPLAAEMARVRGGRDSRLPLMMERLRELDIDITEDDVRDGAAEGAVLGRPHVADALVGKGVVGHRNEAFEKMLGPGGPAFVPRYATSLPHAVELVRAAGGVPVVAHPWGRNRVLTAAALADLQQRGLVGIEVDHQDHAPAAREELRRIAGDLGLVATGSSDWHGTGKVDHELGCNTTAPEELERLLDLAARAAAASGRSTPGVVDA